ncbi:hypothetical protein VQ03_30740 [Methylobacterium tarhaniae]|uniref:Uncharacterized protein n=2 Tax=Methylobacterium TaxID=407 RepID=A0A0J6UIN6_9HYPH|nr:MULTISPECIES: hypothetical protein [Methylobacterium]KMO25776.1 hypothetical protein VQ02_34370 [Methylobacterium variabile]KMO27176.1 hypothetical protein VQ03_30740 [Methylobacterium tarhaniae]
MSKLIVQTPFYFGGAIRDVGSPIEVENATDRKSLIDRGMIAEGKATAAPDNKMEPEPANKGEPASRRIKA